MLAKAVTTGLVGSLLLATAALAEPPTLSQSEAQGTWRVSKVVGLNVYNDANENVGSINELLTEKNGTIKAAVLSVGGFLGMGSHYVAVPYDKIKFVSEPTVYTGASNTNGTPNAGVTKPPPATTTGSSATSPSAVPPPKSNPWYPDHAVFNATKDDLKGMPEFKYSAE